MKCPYGHAAADGSIKYPILSTKSHYNDHLFQLHFDKYEEFPQSLKASIFECKSQCQTVENIQAKTKDCEVKFHKTSDYRIVKCFTSSRISIEICFFFLNFDFFL